MKKINLDDFFNQHYTSICKILNKKTKGDDLIGEAYILLVDLYSKFKPVEDDNTSVEEQLTKYYFNTLKFRVRTWKAEKYLVITQPDKVMFSEDRKKTINIDFLEEKDTSPDYEEFAYGKLLPSLERDFEVHSNSNIAYSHETVFSSALSVSELNKVDKNKILENLWEDGYEDNINKSSESFEFQNKVKTFLLSNNFKEKLVDDYILYYFIFSKNKTVLQEIANKNNISVRILQRKFNKINIFLNKN